MFAPEHKKQVDIQLDNFVLTSVYHVTQKATSIYINHADIFWKSSMASCRQYRRLLECIEDNILSQVIDGPTKGDAILDLLVTKASELIADVKNGGRLNCSDHSLVKFIVLTSMGQVKSKVRMLSFRKAKFQLFMGLVNQIPWETAVRDKGAEQS